MTRFVLVVLLLSFFTPSAWAQEKPAYLKDFRGEQLPGLIEEYKSLLVKATSYAAYEVLTDDLTHLYINVQQYYGTVENWKANKEALECLMVSARWKKLDKRLTEEEADRLIRINEDLTSLQREDRLERLKGKRSINLGAIIDAIQKAAKDGWKVKVVP